MNSTYLILIIAIICNAGANILIKAAMKQSPIFLENAAIFQAVLQALKNPFLIGGVALFGLALAAYSVVLSRLNLSIAYPIMTGAGFLLVFLFSALCFKESISPVHILGAVLILSGVWVLAR
jgi:multidrug transporter EmrE-like cation transporter